ncbi:MAG: alkaline phosphatase family protein [Gluconacetobacter diazotrophicus]|nr:alkaline phosphatase family protein [Gluconacetobacter diazotrophicus]
MPPRLAKRVLLLGWDAADWQILHPLLDRGEMPVLQSLIERGTSGRIATLHPVISPILWNSIATGKRADKHDILGFTEPTPDGTGARPVTSSSRKAKALWNILSQNRLRSGVVNWFASYPAERVRGEVFSNLFVDCMEPREGRRPLDARAVHPPDLLEIAESLRVSLDEISVEQMLPFFPDRLPTDPADTRPRMLARLLAEAATVQNAATYLAEGDDWDFLTVYFNAIDHAGHGFIEYHPPAMEHVSAEDAATYGYIVRGVYRFHDMLLGRLLEVAGPETTVLIVSDHGFYSDHLRPPVSRHTADPLEKFGEAMNPVAWHAQQGFFLAAGEGIKHDELIYGTTLLDVAPTVLALLGLPVPEDMDGRALTQLFTAPVEPARISTYEAPHPLDGMWRDLPPEESDPWAARQAMEQLAELGYIEMPDAGDPEKAAENARWDRRNNLAQVYYTAGRMSETLALLRELIAERPLPALRCHAALCHLALGEPAKAEAEAALVLDDATNEGSLARLVLGQAKLALGKDEEARALFEPLRHLQARLPYLMLAFGRLALRSGDLVEAEAAFRRALERDELNAEAHDALGIVLRRTGRVEDAIYEHMRAASLQHHRSQTHLNLGLALAKNGQTDWAAHAFEVAAELAPADPFPHRLLARLYFSVKKDRERARHHAAEMLRRRQAMRARRQEAARQDG